MASSDLIFSYLWYEKIQVNKYFPASDVDKQLYVHASLSEVILNMEFSHKQK